jgi:hypothetical protein
MSSESVDITDLRKWVQRTREAWEEYQTLGRDDSSTEDQLNRACAYFEWCAERVDYDAVQLLLNEFDAIRAAVNGKGDL